MPRIETMTTDEVTAEMRKLGMRVDNATLRLGLKQGVYPFGLCIERESGGPVFQVFRKKFDEWAADVGYTDEPA